MRPLLGQIAIGTAIGASMSVPGISGAAVAIALGVYTPLLQAAAELRKRENLRFLLRIGLSGLFGFLTGARVLSYALKVLPLTGILFFCGILLGTAVRMIRDLIPKGITLNAVLFALLGILCVQATQSLPREIFDLSPVLLPLLGVLLAVGLILPGISTSHLLAVFGLYETVTKPTPEELPLLLLLAPGILLGIAFLTKPLALAAKRYEREFGWLLVGFCSGSLRALVEPYLQSPQLSFLPWFQAVNGVILGIGGALFAVRRIGARNNRATTS